MESRKALAEIVKNLPRYISLLAAHKSSIFENLGEYLIAGCNEARVIKNNSKRDEVIFSKFAFYVCRFSENFQRDLEEAVKKDALNFIGYAPISFGEQVPENTLYDFCLRNAGSKGYTFAGIGEKIIASLPNMVKLKESSEEGIMACGAKILLEILKS